MRFPGSGKRTIIRLGALLAGALLVSAVMAQVQVRYVWVTFYYDANGVLVGGDSHGDCNLGSWGTLTGYSVVQVYDCDGELPW